MRDTPNTPMRTEPEETLSVLAPTGSARADGRVVGMPAQLGRYRITGVLGQGGMGVVYTAYDPVLAREVAVKLLSFDVGKSAQGRLLREAQAMAKLADPHVVPVHDAGVHDGHVWVAMAKVEGITLREWLKGDHGLDARLDVIVQAGRGLQAAHAAGLVHRDFKPDNVLISESRLGVGRDTEGRVRAQVLDFGLAAQTDLAQIQSETEPTVALPDDEAPQAEAVALARLNSLESRLTRTGAVLGTPAYMSPEQFRGDTVDPRSDQFSFAVTLYEAVWTSRPFGGDHARSIAMAVLHDPPLTPLAQTRTERALWRICSRALARDPAARYPAIADVLAEIERSRARSSTPKLLAVAGLAIAATAGAVLLTSRDEPCTGADALGATVWSPELAAASRDAFIATRKPWARDSAAWVDGALASWRDAWVTQHVEACRATAVLQSQSEALLDRRMACLERQRVEARAIAGVLAVATGDAPKRATRLVAALPDPDACIPDARGELSDELATQDDAEHAAVRERVAQLRARIDAGMIDDAETEIEALDTATAALGDGGLQAQVFTERARWLDEHGDPSAAEWFTRAMLTAVEHDAKSVAGSAARQLAFVEGVRHGRLDAARHLAGIAGALGTAPYQLMLVRAQIEFAAADYARADALIDEAIAAAEADGAPALGQFYNTRGAIALRAGRYPEARADFERAAVAITERLGTEHPELGRIGVNLSLALERSGELDAAIVALQQARAVLVADLGERDPTVATTDHNLAAFLELAGRPAEAIAPCERAIATLDATVGPDDPRVAGPWTVLGRARLMAGDHDGAATAIERAIAIRSKALGPTHPDLALPLVARARLHLAREQADLAIVDTERALALVADATFDTSDRGELAMLHARALEGVGRPLEAAMWRTTAAVHLDAAGPAGRRLRAELESFNAR